MEQFSLPSWSARNPLGIVALFISLIYGMSALLLGTSIHALSPTNQTILVIFIASFPFVVLGVFGWLVARHHMKLYGPSDYRTDKSFLDALGTLPPAEVSKRLEKDIAESEEAKTGSDDQTSVPAQPRSQDSQTTSITLALGAGKSTTLKQAFLVEGMVFQALQREFRASIRRNVRLPNGEEVDGVIEPPDGSIIIVEVKLIGAVKNISGAIYRLQKQTNSILAALERPGLKNVPRIILALVFDGNADEMPKVRTMVDQYREHAGTSTEIRLYSLRELFREYGFPEEPRQ